MNSRLRRGRQSASRLFDVLTPASRQRRNRGAAHLAGDLTDRFGVGRGSDREARFDDVNAQRIERARQSDLGGYVERESGRLLPVAQRRIEDDDSFWNIGHVLICNGPGA